jgi:hypothetical protein
MILANTFGSFDSNVLLIYYILLLLKSNTFQFTKPVNDIMQKRTKHRGNQPRQVKSSQESFNYTTPY